MAWTKGPTIGRGSTAAVSLATTLSGDFFAVKSIGLSSSALLQREESLISQLCSPYIVKCLGSDITSDGYNLFMEYISGGTLSDHIKKQGNSLEESAIRNHAFQLLMGLNYLHGEGIAHCDIKGQNILIGGDGLKIADFGCARRVASGGAAFSGTPAYMAPEVARGEEQSFPADVWALGCTVIEMATGIHPWPEMNDPASALYRIAFSGDVPESPRWLSDEAKDFVTRCLTRDPKERWTAAELLQHPFFSSVTENCAENRGFERISPTSVTDQAFWDAFEASDSSSQNPTEIDLSSDSPASRVRALIGDASPASFDFGEEGDWLTVRANEIEDLIDAEHELVEEGIESSILMEDSLFDCWNEDRSSTCTSFPDAYSESVNDFSEFRIDYFYYFNGIISSSTSNFPTPFQSFTSVSFTDS
ncbi:hypothetical protein ACS0TY_016951 [Phlomoides rotata]